MDAITDFVLTKTRLMFVPDPDESLFQLKIIQIGLYILLSEGFSCIIGVGPTGGLINMLFLKGSAKEESRKLSDKIHVAQQAAFYFSAVSS